MNSMKSIFFENTQQNLEVVLIKRRFGTIYGLTAGLAFSAAAWGWDAYQLSQAHVLQPWLKFIVGAIICGLVGSIAGWLTSRFQRGILSLVFYLGASAVFAWLVLALPLQIFPRLVSLLDPETGSMLNYVYYETFGSRFALAFGWILIFMLLAGILQIPLTEPAAFATSLFGKVAPMLVCALIMVINGTTVDTVLNEPLRSAVLAMNETIQFSVDHLGQEVDPTLSRAMHTVSLRGVKDEIGKPWHLVIGNYDEWLGQINVLVRFGDTWVDCAILYDQPSFCKYADSNGP